MKRLSASSRATVRNSSEECFALLADIDGYPGWYPSGVLDAAVTDRDGEGLPTRGRATLHLSHGPLARDFRLNVAVTTVRHTSIKLARIPHNDRDHEELTVSWLLRPAGERTAIQLDLSANLSIPGLLPVGGVADSLARGFVDAAVAALRG